MGPSFEVVFEAEFPSLHRYLSRRVGGSAGDDLTAATFATAYANWERWDAARPVRPWLYGIAANLVRRHWRDEERMLRAYARTGIDPVLADNDDTLDRVDARSRQRELAAALASLRRGDREILLLHAWAEFSDAEIAAALSLPLGTVSHGCTGRERSCGTGWPPAGNQQRTRRSKQWRNDDDQRQP